MSERRSPRIPAQRAHRIQAENQARGQRARARLSQARDRQRESLERSARRPRRGDHPERVWAGRRRLLACGLFAASFALGLAWTWPALDFAHAWATAVPLRIELIAVQGNSMLSSHDVALATGVRPGEDGFAVETEAVRARLREHPWIRDAHVMRLPTGRLLVSIDERRPVAVLMTSTEAEAASTWRFVDASGTPFAPLDQRAAQLPLDSEDRAWPRLRGGETLLDGQPHPELAAALALARQLSESPLPDLMAARDSLELHLPRPGDPQGWVIDAGDDRPLVILGHEQVGERLARLEALLRSQIGEVRGATQIDLRFVDRAILRSSPASG